MEPSPYYQTTRKKIAYHVLKVKVEQLWQLSELLVLTDLGFEYYLLKISNLDNYNKILHQGPWFIGSQYLIIRQWEPKFNPATANINLSMSRLQIPRS